MELGDTGVKTPYESPESYCPDWRHRIADYLIDNPTARLPAEIRTDRSVRDHMWFLRRKERREDPSRRPGRRYMPMSKSDMLREKAHEWYTEGEGIADFLDALLLTSAPKSHIAEDMSMDEQAVDTYERVYFNARTENDDRIKSPSLRRALALGGQATLSPNSDHKPAWRLIGARFDYPVLACMWNWSGQDSTAADEAETMSGLISSILPGTFLEGMRGNVGVSDLTGLLEQYVTKQKFLFESGEGDAESQAADFVVNVLQTMAPEMSKVAIGESMRNADGVIEIKGIDTSDELEGRISETEIEDRGPQEFNQALDNSIQQRLKPIADKK